MTPDDFDPARGYDNPPACLRCDAKDQEIEALRARVGELKKRCARLAATAQLLRSAGMQYYEPFIRRDMGVEGLDHG